MSAATQTVGKVERLLAVQNLLHREARLLDDRCFDEWVDMFTDDATYSLPIVVGDDPREPSLIRDTKAGMEERVFRLTKTLAHAQNPPSRTQHDVTNIEVEEAADGLLEVRCNQTVHELRNGDVFHVGLAKPRTFAARCRYLIAPGEPWRIKEKTCLLIDREYPLYNLTFIF
ncbi:MAG: aromatic-ring-hydroxylating dioxygenase subunit beta [Nocardioidaceae bacterium]